MNKMQKCISTGFVLVAVLLALRPPWQQTYNGVELSYAGKLGQHFLWQRPPATGETSWMQVVPASKCEVSVDKSLLSWKCGGLFVVTVLLLFAFRTRSRVLGLNDSGSGAGRSDWKYASIAALALICIAAFVMFVVHPFGFEEAIGWFYVFFPGTIVYAANGIELDKVGPPLLRNSLKAFVIFGVSLLWYFAVCDAAIAIWKQLAGRFKHQHCPNS